MNPACCTALAPHVDFDRPVAGPDGENVSGLALGAQEFFIA
jgi:hypothetical protein